MFSLGIPVRNEEKNIKAVIESALSQSLTPEEVLVCVN
jgi:glycosyltransferase involved in cell wall biosynthesis